MGRLADAQPGLGGLHLLSLHSLCSLTQHIAFRHVLWYLSVCLHLCSSHTVLWRGRDGLMATFEFTPDFILSELHRVLRFHFESCSFEWHESFPH